MHCNMAQILENVLFLKSFLISYQNDERLSLWWGIELIMLNFLLTISIMPWIDKLSYFIKIKLWILLNLIFEICITLENDECISSFDIGLENGCHALATFLF